jgi:uncharacterized protein (UPF0333 family)
MKKRGKKKAQISLEFLIVVGFAFLMTIPMFIIFYQQSESINNDVTASQVDKVASEIRDAVDEVFYLGTPSKKSLTVYIPDRVQDITITGNTITFTVDSAGGDYQVVKWAATNISGAIGTGVGIHRITTEAFDDYVSITDA